MIHKGTQTLQTERLILRKLRIEDTQDMFDLWASDERVCRFLSWAPHESPDTTHHFLSAWCNRYDEPSNYDWAIELDGRMIGRVSATVKEEHERAELGYCIGYDYWNKGIMTEAVQAVVDYLFGEIGVHRIQLSHAVKNPSSGRIAIKCGFTYEGTRQETFKTYTGAFLDMAEYGLLKREWEKSRA